MKRDDYDAVSAYGTGNTMSLPKGGYICKIIKAEEISDKNGRPLVHIAFDIIEGEYAGFFEELFKARKKANEDPLKQIKWPFEGQSWVPVLDYEDASKTSRKFKGLCKAIEDSGTPVWAGNELDLKAMEGAEVGVVYQNVEQTYNDRTYWRAVPWAFRNIEAIATGDYFIPDDKPLADTGFSPVQGSAGSYGGGGVDSFKAAEESIPF